MAQINYSACKYRMHRNDDSYVEQDNSGGALQKSILRKCISQFYDKSPHISDYTANRDQFISAGLPPDANIQHGNTNFPHNSQGSPHNFVQNESGSQSTYSFQNISKVPLSSKTSDECKEMLEPSSKQERFKDSLTFESRQDLEEAVRAGIVPRKMLSSAEETRSSFSGNSYVVIKKKKRPAVDPNHPLNHLVDIEQNLFKKSRPENPISCCNAVSFNESSYQTLPSNLISSSSSSILVLNKNAEELHQNNSSSTLEDKGSYTGNSHRNVNSQWDVRNTAVGTSSTEFNQVKEKHEHEGLKYASKGDLKTSGDLMKPAVDHTKDYDLLPICVIKDHCLTLKDILSKFPNYDCGQPNSTLYIKNLARQVTVPDIVSLFGNFECEDKKTEYELLKGRMRGQAFVKFGSIDAASRALKTCLGFPLKGKPIVIHFGKHKK